MRQVYYGVGNLSAATNFMNPVSGDAGGAVFTSGSVWPAEGKYGRIHFHVAASPGGGNSYDFTIRINNSNTSSTVSIAGSETDAFIEAMEPISPGDIVEIEALKTGSPPTQVVFFYAVFSSGNTNFSTLSGGCVANLTQTQGTSEFFPMTGLVVNSNTTQNHTEFPCPADGTLRDHYVDLTSTPGAGATRRFFVLINGTRRLSISITGSNFTGNDTGSIAVAAGDLLTFEAETPSFGTVPSATRCKMSCVFESDNADEFIITSVPINQPSNGVNNHGYLYSGELLLSPGAGAFKRVRGDIDYLAMYASLAVAPGVGKTRRFRIRQGTTGTGLNLLISDTATAGNITSTVAMVEQGLVDYRTRPTGTPASTHVGVGVLAKFNARVSNPFLSNF